MDVGFYLDNMISDELQTAILENRRQILESIKFRAKVGVNSCVPSVFKYLPLSGDSKVK